MEPRFYDPWIEIQKHGHTLPHWQQSGATFFITFRLADSIPHAKLGAWKHERAAWTAAHPEPWSADVESDFHQRFSRRLDLWMDEGHGECVLRDPLVAADVARTLRKFNGVRHAHHAWVIMPNHVHALCTLATGQKLEKVLQGWKGVSANLANKTLGRSGPLWQENYFDRLVRDGDHFWRCARYIRLNPNRAKLRAGEFVLWESGAVKCRLDECGA